MSLISPNIVKQRTIMRYILTLLIALMAHTAIAQPHDETERLLDNIKEQIKNAYNNDEGSAVMGVLGDAMQRQFTDEQLKKFFSDMKSEYGQMHEWELKGLNGQVAYYKVMAERKELLATLILGNDARLNGMKFVPYPEGQLASMDSNITKMSLPFSGEWYTMWGGDNPDQNQHATSRAQRYAMDFVMVDEKGASHKGNGVDNEDYYAFGQNIIAPCDATVVEAVDGVRDNTPGEMNTMHTGGNMVMLKAANGEVIVLAHFKNGSVKVKAGNPVKKGEVLGQCGNSGNSSEPHLHMHLQNSASPALATAIRCYFEKLKVTPANDKPANKENYMPVRGDKVRSL